MARLYADEIFSYPVVEILRNLGHDVVTVQETGRSGGDDASVLADATADARAVLTFDNDFWRLHKATPAHAGIVRCKMFGPPDLLAARIDHELSTVSSLLGQFVRVNRNP